MQKVDSYPAVPPPDQDAIPAKRPTSLSRKGPMHWWLVFEDRVVLNLATALMIGAMAVMFYEASSRSLLSESHWWAEELVRFLVVWSILLTIGIASRHHHFIRMDMVVRMLPHRMQLAMAMINSVAGLAFCVLLVIAGYQEVSHLHHIGMFTDSNLDLPLWVVRLILPIGGALYGLYFVMSAAAVLRGVDPNEQPVDRASEEEVS